MLKNFKEFKKSSNGVIFPKEIFKRGSNMSLSPLIFTKKIPNLKMAKSNNPFVISFENYLTLIVQMYYKSSFYITENVFNFVNFEKKSEAKKQINEKKGAESLGSTQLDALSETLNDTQSKQDDFEMEKEELENCRVSSSVGWSFFPIFLESEFTSGPLRLLH